jgi:hypothetical protein
MLKLAFNAQGSKPILTLFMIKLKVLMLFSLLYR